MRAGKTTGPDRVPMDLLKWSPDLLTDGAELTGLPEECCTVGALPTTMAQSWVVALDKPKKGTHCAEGGAEMGAL